MRAHQQTYPHTRTQWETTDQRERRTQTDVLGEARHALEWERQRRARDEGRTGELYLDGLISEDLLAPRRELRRPYAERDEWRNGQERRELYSSRSENGPDRGMRSLERDHERERTGGLRYIEPRSRADLQPFDRRSRSDDARGGRQHAGLDRGPSSRRSALKRRHENDIGTLLQSPPLTVNGQELEWGVGVHSNPSMYQPFN